jgi:ABC-type sugar transport system substrate-binding protein
MRKCMAPILLATIVAVLILTGCATPTPSPTPAPTPTPSPTPAPTPTPTPAPAPTAESLIAADIPELQELIAKGALDPNLLMNPFGEDFAVKPDGTPYKIAFVQLIMLVEATIDMEGVLRSLVTRAGADYSFYDSNYDVQQEMSHLANIRTTLRPDALVIFPVEPFMSAPAVEEVIASGIPVYNMGVFVESENVRCRVSFSRYGAGLAIGEWFKQKADETGKQFNILEMWGDHGLTQDVRFGDGVADSGVAEHPLCTLREAPDSRWAMDIDQANVRDAFTAHPELNAIIAHGGSQGISAVQVLKEIGRYYPVGHPDHVTLLIPETDSTVLAALIEGDLDILGGHNFWVDTDIAAKIMFNDLVLGQSPPRRDIWLDVPLISRDTMYEMQEYRAPAIATLMPPAKWDLWPVLDTSWLGIETPTKAMRMQYQGY